MPTPRTPFPQDIPVKLSPYSMDIGGFAGCLRLVSGDEVVISVSPEDVAALRRRRLWNAQIAEEPPVVVQVGELSCRDERFEVRLSLRHDLCLRASASATLRKAC
jgi:hypothetical protein